MASRGTDNGTLQEHRFGSNIYIAFVPWVLFSVITTHAEVKAAAVLALVAAILISVPSIRDGRPKALKIGAIIAFVGFTIVALTADAATDEWLASIRTRNLGRLAGANRLRFPVAFAAIKIYK